MKRLPPASPIGKIKFYFAKYKYRFLWLLLWVLTVIGAAVAQKASQIEPVATVAVCQFSTDLRAGEYVKPENLTTKHLALAYLPNNAITDCTQTALFESPLSHSVQSGDLLQPSTFENDQLKYLTQSLSESKRLMYLNASDIHALPPRFNSGQIITLYAKGKDMPTAIAVLTQVQVVDVIKGKDTNGNEQLVQFGVSVTDPEAIELSRALAEKWELQLAVIK